MRLQGLIFDFDGTLADTIPVCLTAFRQVFREYLKQEPSDAEITAMFGPSEEGIIQRHVGDRWEDAFGVYLDAYEAAHDACVEPFPGIPDLLDLLRDHGIMTAIVTGKGEGSAAISFSRLDLTRYFDIIEVGSMRGSVKPEAIRSIVERWGVPPEHVAYVGDSPNDVRDSREAGVTALAAGWAPTADVDALQAASPDAFFARVDELREWIEHNIHE